MKYRIARLIGLLTMLTACGHYEVGDYYRKGALKGLVLELDDEGRPALVLSLDEATDLDADSANAWCRGYDDGSWRLPDKREMTQIKKYRSLLNQTLGRKGEQLLGTNIFYWTSTPCSETHIYARGPLGIKCYFRSNHSAQYRCRAVRTIDN